MDHLGHTLGGQDAPSSEITRQLTASAALSAPEASAAPAPPSPLATDSSSVGANGLPYAYSELLADDQTGQSARVAAESSAAPKPATVAPIVDAAPPVQDEEGREMSHAHSSPDARPTTP